MIFLRHRSSVSCGCCCLGFARACMHAWRAGGGQRGYWFNLLGWKCPLALLFLSMDGTGSTFSNSSILYFLGFSPHNQHLVAFSKFPPYICRFSSDSLLRQRHFVLEVSVSEWVRPWLCCKQRIPSAAVARTAAPDNKAACVRSSCHRHRCLRVG